MKVVAGGNTSIVLQRFNAFGFGVDTHKGDVINLQLFGSGEEGHIQWVVVKRVNQGAFFQHHIAEVCFFTFQRAGNANGTGADNEDVIIPDITHSLDCLGILWCLKDSQNETQNSQPPVHLRQLQLILKHFHR